MTKACHDSALDDRQSLACKDANIQLRFCLHVSSH
jgi:hypothetical protein